VATSTNLAGKIIRLATWFLLTPFILRELGPVEYSIWVLVGSLAGYGSLLDLGLGSAIVKYVAQHIARDERPEARRMLSTVLWLYIVLGLVALLAALLVAPLFPGFFAIPTEYHDLAVVVVILTGISLAIELPATAAPSVLLGLQRYDVSNVISTISTLVSAAATVIVLTLGGGLIGMVALNIPVALATQAVSLIAIHWVEPELRFRLTGASRKLVRSIFSYSLFSFGFQVAGLLQLKTDEIVVGRFLPVQSVGPYAIGRRASDFVLIVTDQFLRVLLPLASQFDAVDDQARLKGLYLTATRLAIALSLPVGAALIVLAEPFIVAWVGPEYLLAAPVLVVLALAQIVGLAQWPAGAILQGIARHRWLAISALATGVANLFLSIVLVQRMGPVGVAFGTLIPTTIEALAIVLPYSTRVLGISIREVVVRSFVPALLPGIPSILVTVAAREILHPSSLFTVGLNAAVGVATYGVLYAAYGAGPLERDLMRRAWIEVRGIVTRTGREDPRPPTAGNKS
jgi:O-antigen/teichoic acid export membrane protein